MLPVLTVLYRQAVHSPLFAHTFSHQGDASVAHHRSQPPLPKTATTALLSEQPAAREPPARAPALQATPARKVPPGMAVTTWQELVPSPCASSPLLPAVYQAEPLQHGLCLPDDSAAVPATVATPVVTLAAYRHAHWQQRLPGLQGRSPSQPKNHYCPAAGQPCQSASDQLSSRAAPHSIAAAVPAALPLIAA